MGEGSAPRGKGNHHNSNMRRTFQDSVPVETGFILGHGTHLLSTMNRSRELNRLAVRYTFGPLTFKHDWMDEPHTRVRNFSSLSISFVFLRLLCSRLGMLRMANTLGKSVPAQYMPQLRAAVPEEEAVEA